MRVNHEGIMIERIPCWESKEWKTERLEGSLEREKESQGREESIFSDYGLGQGDYWKGKGEDLLGL